MLYMGERRPKDTHFAYSLITRKLAEVSWSDYRVSFEIQGTIFRFQAVQNGGPKFYGRPHGSQRAVDFRPRSPLPGARPLPQSKCVRALECLPRRKNGYQKNVNKKFLT
jgi:hypothetical protein